MGYKISRLAGKVQCDQKLPSAQYPPPGILCHHHKSPQLSRAGISLYFPTVKRREWNKVYVNQSSILIFCGIYIDALLHRMVARSRIAGRISMSNVGR